MKNHRPTALCPQSELVFVLKLFTCTGMNGGCVFHLGTADAGRGSGSLITSGRRTKVRAAGGVG